MLATTNLAELPTGEDCLHRDREAKVVFGELLLHLTEQRFVGELHAATERIAEQLATELPQESVAASGHEVVAQVG